jgi:hypothetical protein
MIFQNLSCIIKVECRLTYGKIMKEDQRLPAKKKARAVLGRVEAVPQLTRRYAALTAPCAFLTAPPSYPSYSEVSDIGAAIQR